MSFFGGKIHIFTLGSGSSEKAVVLDLIDCLDAMHLDLRHGRSLFVKSR